MPWILHRYIMGELLRVFLLCTTVLVLVVAFGAAIKPLAADDLAGPLQVAKYIMLAIVPMLQFALPFSAGFAATVVMHRMTTDNEILAASVSGLSYRRILLPIAALGVVLLVVMVLLTQSVIPRFWESIQKMLARDVTRLIVSSIRKGVPIQFGDVQIHADTLLVQESPPDTGAQTRLILLGVVAAKLDPEGRIIADVSARQAVVDIHRLENRTVLKIAMADTVGYDAESGQLARAPQIMDSFTVADPLGDDPRFMTRTRLLELRDDPNDFPPVINAKRRVAEALRDAEVSREIARAVGADGSVTFAGGWSGGERRLVVTADGFSMGRFITAASRPVVVHQLDAAGQPVRRIIAETATVRRAAGSTLSHPSVDLLLGRCEVVDLRSSGVTNKRPGLDIPNLTLPALAGDDPSLLPYVQLLERVNAAHDVDKAMAAWLVYTVDHLNRDIRSLILRRYALSCTAMLLLVLGATLAMWLRHSAPLVVYVWAFLPSVVDMILIASGDHAARAGQMTGGLMLMWSGNALLLGTLLYVYLRLARN
ncbi:MAG: LptF/LptG family permease [Planctomycetes bacterium]|nr:LptF/LptG family permease [Planctomycetota bacterium]